MNYYKLREDNTIEQYTTIPDGEPVPSFIEEQFTATERSIIRLHDGTLAFEDEVDMKAEEKAVAKQNEQIRVSQLQPTIEERMSATEEMLLAMVEENERLLGIIDELTSSQKGE